MAGRLAFVWPRWDRGKSPRLCVLVVGAWRVQSASCDPVVAWQVPSGSFGRGRGVAGPLGFVWPRFGCGGLPLVRAATVGMSLVALGSWGRSGYVAGTLGFVAAVVAWRSPRVRVDAWGRGEFPRVRVAAVRAWRVLSCFCGRLGGVAGPLSFKWPRWVVLVPLCFVWLWWKRGGSRRGRPLGFVWPPWGHGRSPGLPVAARGAWPLPWASCGRRGGVAGPLGLMWLP